jgi:cytochrome c peroxidase
VAITAASNGEVSNRSGATKCPPATTPLNISFNYTTAASDPGLAGFTGSSAHLGKFRTPTTRNVALGVNRTYMHNGVLKSLKQVVDFYNPRDLLRACTAQEIATLHPSQ